MAKTDSRKKQFEKLAKTRPVLPVISDHPLDEHTAFEDRFDLCHRLGPVFDIIRYDKTSTPTTIAIYGDWGTGKSSAMKWLEGLIAEWNKNTKAADKTRIHTVWFYPWKYHDKQDVWRGLISEVIIKSIDVKEATIARVTKAAKQFGLFLGRGFVHLLAGLKLKAGVKKVGEAEFDLSCIKEILAEYNQTAHPEKAFLNEFESSLKEWIGDTLDDNERMVIFIDDLDRCMPEIALQVLEALKLYLNIEKLIFVVGVDKDVINPLVKKHYEELGLEGYKSENYLAKMFQTEVSVGPSEKQVTEYLDYHLERIEYFKKPYVEDTERTLFRNLINKLADRNPREVKRLINSAVMAGAGAEMMKQAGRQETSLSFKQGLQVFFIRWILEKRYNMPRVVGSKIGNSFFGEWSGIIRKNIAKDPNFPCSINVPKDFGKELSEDMDIEQKTKKRLDKTFLSFAPKAYYDLLKEPSFSEYIRLLSDTDLGQLMQIEYSVEIAEITQKAEPQSTKEYDAQKILKAIASRLDKETKQLKQQDYRKVNMLNLAGLAISDLSHLAALTKLTMLYLRDNQISDLSPLGALTNLRSLYLRDNQIRDLSPLAALTNLARLDLEDNQISDLSPLEALTKLRVLVLYHNQISDLSPLAALTNLRKLHLYLNQISDLSPLADLKNLTELYLNHNQIRDFSPLAALTNLTELYLQNNQISDLSPLAVLKNLTQLDLSDNQISDLSPLAALTNLTQLDLQNNQIRDLSPLKALTNLTELILYNNQIRDLSPLKALTNLTELHLQDNQVSDLSTLAALTKLKILNIRRCEDINEGEVDKLQKALPDLVIEW
jgi:Leucine-rich repeat (LRR) protein